MLVLSRHVSEKITIAHKGETLELLIVEIGRNRVRVGIEAPADFKIYRNELLTRLNLEDNSDSAPVG